MQLQEFKMTLGHHFIEANDESSDSTDSESDGILEPKHKRRKVAIVPLPSDHKKSQKAAHMPIDFSSKQMSSIGLQTKKQDQVLKM